MRALEQLRMNCAVFLAVGIAVHISAPAAADQLADERASETQALAQELRTRTAGAQWMLKRDLASMNLELDTNWLEPSAVDIALNTAAFGAMQDEQAPAPAPTPGAQAPAASAEELAKQLANPIASLISVPFQSNFDFGSGPAGDGFRYTLNVQPVIPIKLNDEWTLISRTIVPLVYQNDDASPLTNEDSFGIGDVVQSFFFTPTTGSAFTWGVGPVIYLPTATEDVIGADQWGLGPTFVALYADGPWTFGGLANHIWSIGETDAYDDFFVDKPLINSTFLQPFVSYAAGGGWSFGATLEATYDWDAEQWTVPLFLNASKVFSVGGQMMSLQAGPRLYLETPANGPEWGFRINLTLLFPN